jgi:putative flippase GtrA
MWLLVRVCGANAVTASLLISFFFAIANFVAQRNWAFRRMAPAKSRHHAPAASR